MSLSRDIISLDNEGMTCATTEEEIAQVVHQISTHKAPRLNGMRAISSKMLEYY